jgi:spore germination protein
MEIYVVQYGDRIEAIADRYGITVEKLISDNGLINPYNLVVGQALVILYPKKTYIVQEGDTLAGIAAANGISEMVLIRNNPFLYDREFIYPGDSLVISYNTIRDLEVNGYTNAFIKPDVLTRALPYLTYLSIYNYQLTSDERGIISHGDDTAIIQMAKQYDTIPLLMVSALSPIGEVSIEFVYQILLDNKLQDRLINSIYETLKAKEFSGINLLINYITDYNQGLYLNLFTKLSEKIRSEGYSFMLTISPDFAVYQNLDYQKISLLADKIIFLQNIWRKRRQPPAPISNISHIRPFIERVTNMVSPNFISLGKPLIGYDWIVPFVPGSTASLLSLSSAIVLAYDQGVEIRLDEESQTPYFTYYRAIAGTTEGHVVWFIDARSINAFDNVILDYNLVGTGIWNITSYNQQLFSITNATFNIIKLPMELK